MCIIYVRTQIDLKHVLITTSVIRYRRTVTYYTIRSNIRLKEKAVGTPIPILDTRLVVACQVRPDKLSFGRITVIFNSIAKIIVNGFRSELEHRLERRNTLWIVSRDYYILVDFYFSWYSISCVYRSQLKFQFQKLFNINFPNLFSPSEEYNRRTTN